MFIFFCPRSFSIRTLQSFSVNENEFFAIFVSLSDLLIFLIAPCFLLFREMFGCFFSYVPTPSREILDVVFFLLLFNVSYFFSSFPLFFLDV